MQRNQPPSFFSCCMRSVLAALVLVLPSTTTLADILRRSVSSAASTSTTSSSTSGAAATTAATATPRDSLKRAKSVAEAVAVAQAQAQQIAASQSPTTLTLQKATDGLWVGADPLSTTTNKDDSKTYSITQTQQQAYLEWTKFDLGSKDTLNFDQSAGGSSKSEWIAFNYVRDPSGDPSKIYGSINADGQVYILNTNGILFGGTAQVNTHALVASSLPINPTLLQRGILVQNAQDVQFLFSGLDTSYFKPSEAVDGVAPEQTAYSSSGYGSITVDSGARLIAKDDAANHSGGRIVLVGPNVYNNGYIEANDGQAILAAGLQVGFVAHASSDATLRGLDVFVGKVEYDSSSGVSSDGVVGTAENSAASAAESAAGYIKSYRGSVYLTGKTVNQNGVIDSNTSVSYNGRIDLVAGYNAVENSLYNSSSVYAALQQPFYYSSDNGENSGAITLGANSVTRILPDVTSTDKITGDLALPSQINIQGKSVYFAPSSILLAPAAAVPSSASAYGADGIALPAGVSVRAGRWYSLLQGTNSLSSPSFVRTDDVQQIFVDDSAVIDVAGLTANDIVALGGVLPSVSEFFISVELRGTELANYPVQRDGALRGQTVVVDIRNHGAWDSNAEEYAWVGTPLADLSGWVSLVTHSIAELSINGGSLALSSGGPVVVKPTASIDVSGGSLYYTAAAAQTTKVRAGLQIIDIANASADQVYDGIYTGAASSVDSKWGVSSTRTVSLQTSDGVLQPGYWQGGNGGSVSISAPLVALDGTIEGKTTAGLEQTTLSPLYSSSSPMTPGVSKAPLWLVSALSLPTPSEFSLSVGRQYQSSSSSASFGSDSPTPLNIVISDTAGASAFSKVSFDATGEYSDVINNRYELDLSTSLVDSSKGSGLGVVIIDNSNDNEESAEPVSGSLAVGSITIAAGAKLSTTQAGANFTLLAGNIYLGKGAEIQAPAGTLVLDAYDVAPSLAGTYANKASSAINYNSERGNIVVADDVTLSVAGQTVDYRLGAASILATQVLNAGSVTIQGSSVSLADSSVIDVSGGWRISTSGKITYGNAGKITINSGLALGTSTNFGSVVGGQLHLGAELEGYAGVGATSGQLEIQAASISVDDTSDPNLLLSCDEMTGQLHLYDAFFDAGGFSSFKLTGLGVSIDSTGAWVGSRPSLVVSDNQDGSAHILAPQVKNWIDYPGQGVVADLLPGDNSGLRSAVALSFAAKGLLKDINGNLIVDAAGNALVNDTSVSFGANTVVNAGVGSSSSVSISAGTDGTIDLLGKIIAKGGTLSVTQSSGHNVAGTYLPTVYLGPGCVLDASGAVVYSEDNTGYHASGVADGGKISIDGDIVSAGATLNVSGYASDGIKVASSPDAMAGLSGTATTSLVSVTKASNGGSITLKGENILLFSGNLLGAGGASKDGKYVGTAGSLTVQSRLAANLGAQNIVVTAADPVMTLTTDLTDRAFIYNGFASAVTDASKNPIGGTDGYGWINFNTDLIKSGQFGSLSFLGGTNGGSIKVSGDVSLSASRQIRFADNGIISFGDSSSLTLSAPYVDVGLDFSVPGYSTTLKAAPTSGSGQLSVIASSLVDVGTLVTLGASQVSIDATHNGTSAGAIRGDGTLAAAGRIDLTAAQIYPPTEQSFTIIAKDDTITGAAGTVAISNGGQSSASTPLSAGGTLAIYASEIEQGGYLSAPLGQIILGNSSVSATDGVTGLALPVTALVTLKSGSVTTVSADGLTIPYGIDVNGDTWIDPSGTDITVAGPTAATKKISIVGNSVDIEGADSTAKTAAAVVDISGGGDLQSYRFVTGTTGTHDILSASTYSFAIIPTAYADLYAPYAPYNDVSATAETNLSNDLGYVFNSKSNVAVGTRIHLAAGGGLPEGDYTILPARYALLSGAYLVTLKKSSYTADSSFSVAQADGSALVSGYLFSGFESAGQPASSSQAWLYQTFEVVSQSVLAKRAQYDTYSATDFFTAEAKSNDATVARLPVDAGQVVLNAQLALNFQGTIAASYSSAKGGRPSLVDITTGASAIQIGGSVDAAASSSTLLLDPAQLDNLGSVLVGGYRTTGTSATSITVGISHLDVASDAVISGVSDLILVSGNLLTVEGGASISSSSVSDFAADSLTLSGNGALVRVSSDATATISRSSGSAGTLSVGTTGGNAVVLGGASVTLDSASAASIAGNALLGGSSSTVNLSAAGILLQADASSSTAASGLTLQGAFLERLGTVAALSLRSYKDITFLGDVTLGSSSLEQLSLHAAVIRGAAQSAQAATVQAKTILIDNDSAVQASALQGTAGGNIVFQAGEDLLLGSGNVSIDDFSGAAFSAGREVMLQGKMVDSTTAAVVTSTLFVNNGDLTVSTPVILSAATANQTLSASHAISLLPLSGTQTASTAKLAGSLTLTGESVAVGTKIILPSGTVSIASSGSAGISVSGKIDVGGVTSSFYDVSQASGGGSVSLDAAQGNVDLSGATINVGRSTSDTGSVTWTGNAGTLSVAAPQGQLITAGTELNGEGGKGGLGGSFVLDAKTVSPDGNGDSSLASLHAALHSFDNSINIRIRSGNVNVDGSVRAHAYSLSADNGDIVVKSGVGIDASGLAGLAATDYATGLSWMDVETPAVSLDDIAGLSTDALDRVTGGSISLYAAGNVKLESGAGLSVAGYCYNDAGKAGTITLSAGSYNGSVNKTATVSISSGSRLDLGVLTGHAFTPEDMVLAESSTPATSTLSSLSGGGTLILSESREALLNDPTQFNGLANLLDRQDKQGINGAASVLIAGYKAYDLSASGGIIDSALQTEVQYDAAAFVDALYVSSVDGAGNTPLFSGKMSVQPGVEIVNGADIGVSPVSVTDSSTKVTTSLSVGSISALTGTQSLVLSTGGSMLTLGSSSYIIPAANTPLRFYSAVAANTFSYTAAVGTVVTIKGPDGVIILQTTVTSAKATKITTVLPVGSTITFSQTGAKLTAASATTSALVLSSGSYTTSGKASLTAAAGDLTLLTTWDLAQQSSYAVSTAGGSVTGAAGALFAFPQGSGTGEVVSFGADATVIYADGTTQDITSGGSLYLPALAKVLLKTSGSLSFASGTRVVMPSPVVDNSLNQTITFDSSTPGAASTLTTTVAGETLSFASGTGDSTVSITGNAVIRDQFGQIKDVGTSNISLNAYDTITFTDANSTLTFSSGATPFDITLPSSAKVVLSNAAIKTSSGDIALGSSWSLGSKSYDFRFGPNNDEPGYLVLRASGNVILPTQSTGSSTSQTAAGAASLSDGFDATNNVLNASSSLWTAYPIAGKSWSYRLVAGADMAAADDRSVVFGAGSVQVGKGSPALQKSVSNASRSSIIPLWYQTIRTGTGDIEIYAGTDVQLLNPLATIYTSGRTASTLANFDIPDLQENIDDNFAPYYGAVYTQNGGNVIINAKHDIIRELLNTSTGVYTDQSSLEMPTSWLYRRGTVSSDGTFSTYDSLTTEVQSTSWWVDFSNFYDDVGALGGGSVELTAGRDVKNINASVPTNMRVTKQTGTGDTLAVDQTKVELGGGDLTVSAGRNIDGGVYYAERGTIELDAGADIKTNYTRNTTNSTSPQTTDATTWLATTLFLGEGKVDVEAGGDLLLGSVANPFWFYEGAGNTTYEESYFSTFDPTDSVVASSLGGDLTVRMDPAGATSGSASLATWYATNLFSRRGASAQPWAWLEGDRSASSIATAGMAILASITPATLKLTSFLGDVNVVGTVNLMPSSTGTLDILASGAVNGLDINYYNGSSHLWATAMLNLSDVSPDSLPGLINPITPTADNNGQINQNILNTIRPFFAETGSTSLNFAQKLTLHGEVENASGDSVPLHTGDTTPVHLYARSGDISGLTLYSGKVTDVVAGNDITDVAFYIQQLQATDTSVISAERDIVLYDPTSSLRRQAATSGMLMTYTAGSVGVATGAPDAGDIQVAGMGSVEVLAGRNLDLGNGSTARTDGIARGITTIGGLSNPYLNQDEGASIMAAAGLGSVYTTTAESSRLTPGLATTGLNYGKFIADFLDPNQGDSDAARYLPVLATLMGITDTDEQAIWNAFGYSADVPLSEKQANWVMKVFEIVLRDAGRDRLNGDSPYKGTYTRGYVAINDLMGTNAVGSTGNIALSQRMISTLRGGDIQLVAPAGGVTVGLTSDPQSSDQGILTQHGGVIDIFALNSVDVGTSRIFTLRGGDEIIWSSLGNIAAGSGSKTVAAAPPTRVLIDPQSADVQNDLAGLATGSGIGVLATLAGVEPGDVDLIAPVGTIDAGDAGIRSSGKVNVSAAVIVNASNIQSSAGTTGTPVVAVSNVASVASASNTSAGVASTATEAAKQQQRSVTQQKEEVLPSIIQVEVLGYGGGDGDEQLSSAKTSSDQG